MIENVVDRLGFLLATRCDISTELEFIASDFLDFLCLRDALNALPFSLLCEVIVRGSVKFQSDDGLITSSVKARKRLSKSLASWNQSDWNSAGLT
jgi:hypothetical protein